MKVIIARNAEARSNAAIARVASALEHEVEHISLLTRTRFSKDGFGVKKLSYKIGEKKTPNYEIRIKSEPGKGIVNIFQLLIFQVITFYWLMKNKEKYDIIHAFDLDVGIPALLVSSITKKKYVYHIADFYVDSRGNIPNLLRSFLKKLEFIVINNAEATIICTEERLEQIKGSRPKKLAVIHNTPRVQEEFFEKIFEENNINKFDSKNIIITYVGGLTKNRFIKDAIEVIRDYPSIILNIAGMGALTDYVIETDKNYSNINYFGIVDYNEALEMYLKTDFMFSIYDPNTPNHKYAAPNKVYEAMLLGKPIIVSNGTSIDKIVMENNMGIAIDYNKEEFRKVIKSISEDLINYTELGENSKKAYEKYSWEIMKNRIIYLYRELIDE